jgi:para-aminobenzoate synthetase component 1
LKTISKNEMRARGIYCGALGWVHGDKAEIAVGIRTFWKGDDGILRFGTGAGITWGSDPLSEWKETQLKARRLISIAGGDL